ncbi:MAG: LuxR C-terminal-related transcriptional regulator [Solirubrobacterales bacterium]
MAPTATEALFPRTKFHRPPVRDEHVERSLLLGAIEASHARVVVLSGPPGFGKSTLAAQWLAGRGESERTAWLSLDPDDQGARFWLAVLAALEPVLGSESLTEVRDAAQAPDPEIRDEVLIGLLDALDSEPEPIDLVLDDLHLVDDEPTLELLDWFIDHLPHQHRVLIATRREPSFASLTRMRVHGDCLEIRADDLRFSAGEVGSFLTAGLGLDLTSDQVATLERLTEGWPAALYLAATRLRLGESLEHVAEQLRSSDEDLIGSLADEVLRSYPAHVSRFALEASVLDRFSLDLCLIVLGSDEQRRTREAFRELTRTSLLVGSLDADRTWFRFHHLLRDVLRSRMAESDSKRVRELHVRAGRWFESEGGEEELHEAMGHYLAAEEWDLAAELLARHGVAFVQSGALGGLAREWLARFPADVVPADARLCFISAMLAALRGDRAERDRWLELGAEAGWEGPMPDGTPSFELAALALAALLCFDDLGGAIDAATEALETLPAASALGTAVEAMTAWHLHLLGRGGEAERMALTAREEHRRQPSATPPLVAYLPAAVLALEALGRDDAARARILVAGLIQRRGQGPLRSVPQSLPVICAAARLATATGDPGVAIGFCETGLELARGWRDSSLMVPATMLELARAQAADDDAEGARMTLREAAARIATARDPGVLRGWIGELESSLASAGAEGAVSAEGSDELSEREIEVLRALTGSGSLREIADSLFISHNTIKTHVRTLYFKLGVSSREAAVARGRELGLL